MANEIYFNDVPVNIPQTLYMIQEFDDIHEAIKKLCELFEKQIENSNQLFEMFKQQDDLCCRLIDTLYKIAPDLEIIECLADSEEEEEHELIEKYMNHGDYIE